MTDETVVDETATEEVVNPFAVPGAEPRRRGRPKGSRNKPKSVDVADYDDAEGLPKRRGRPRKVQKLTPKQVADLTLMAHTMVASSLGPKAMITPEQADALGEAVVPVLEDYGVVLASKMVHLVVLVTTVAMVEGPVVMGVLQDVQTRARERRQEHELHNVVQGPIPIEPSPNGFTPSDIATYRGVEIGQPNTES